MSAPEEHEDDVLNDDVHDGHADDGERVRGERRRRWAAGVAAGASMPGAVRAREAAEAAGKVADVIVSTASAKRVPSVTRQQSDFLTQEAGWARASTKRRDQLKGHLFEDLDIAAYNEKNAAAGRVLVKNLDHRQATYDATRYANGKWAGKVQHKASALGTETAIHKMEMKTPGSASRGTLRVPKDEYAVTTRRARGRTRVAASDITTEQLNNTLDTGLALIHRSVGRSRPGLRFK